MVLDQIPLARLLENAASPPIPRVSKDLRVFQKNDVKSFATICDKKWRSFAYFQQKCQIKTRLFLAPTGRRHETRSKAGRGP